MAVGGRYSGCAALPRRPDGEGGFSVGVRSALLCGHPGESTGWESSRCLHAPGFAPREHVPLPVFAASPKSVEGDSASERPVVSQSRQLASGNFGDPLFVFPAWRNFRCHFPDSFLKSLQGGTPRASAMREASSGSGRLPRSILEIRPWYVATRSASCVWESSACTRAIFNGDTMLCKLN